MVDGGGIRRDVCTALMDAGQSIVGDYLKWLLTDIEEIKTIKDSLYMYGVFCGMDYIKDL